MIAAHNLASARDQSWSRFWEAPERDGIAEALLEQDSLCAQFLGDLTAYDRMAQVAAQLETVQPGSARAALVAAQVATSTHRFGDARTALTQARQAGALDDDCDRVELAIDQACGTALDQVLAKRLQRAAASNRLEDWLPLGALHADMGHHGRAQHAYIQGLAAYRDVSPFAPAWLCFQLGMLWGEQMPKPHPEEAARWYRKAIDYVPGYVKARVHLAEIVLDEGRAKDALALLAPALESGDPEAAWRAADAHAVLGHAQQVGLWMHAAATGFERLLDRHLLAFADHAAEFFAGSGNDAARAFDLAGCDLKNRPTVQSFERAHATALAAGRMREARAIRAAGRAQWGDCEAFRSSALAHASIPTEAANDH